MPQSHRVDQLILSSPETGATGDCWRACIASILGLTPEAVPHFVELGGDDWLEHTVQWLEEHGYGLIRLSDDDLVGCHGKPLWIQAGASPRGETLRHAVVMRGWELWHDPHPSRAGLASGPFVHWVLVVSNPVTPEQK